MFDGMFGYGKRGIISGGLGHCIWVQGVVGSLVYGWEDSMEKAFTRTEEPRDSQSMGYLNDIGLIDPHGIIMEKRLRYADRTLPFS